MLEKWFKSSALALMLMFVQCTHLRFVHWTHQHQRACTGFESFLSQQDLRIYWPISISSLLHFLHIDKPELKFIIVITIVISFSMYNAMNSGSISFQFAKIKLDCTITITICAWLKLTIMNFSIHKNKENNNNKA